MESFFLQLYLLNYVDVYEEYGKTQILGVR